MNWEPDHPRIRGEHDKDQHTQAMIMGSSPHTRGARRQAGLGRAVFRIIPAYAGSTNDNVKYVIIAEDHPRIRGEHCCAEMDFAVFQGSSPHTRGARRRSATPRSRIRIIPAYAGSTVSLLVSHLKPSDHPRIRGEHNTTDQSEAFSAGSSPHTRGAPGRPGRRPRRRGIIPAYAGSTLGNPCNTKDRRRDYTSFPLPVTHPSGGGGS